MVKKVHGKQYDQWDAKSLAAWPSASLDSRLFALWAGPANARIFTVSYALL